MEQYVQENIEVIRHILGYTQTQLADKIGISRVYLGQLESGKADLQRTVALAFMTIIIAIYNSGELDTEGMTYKLLEHFVERFQKSILEMVL